MRFIALLICLMSIAVSAFAQQAVETTNTQIDTTTVIAIAGAAWSILSEVLSFLPKVKANGVIQLVVNILGLLGGKKSQI